MITYLFQKVSKFRPTSLVWRYKASSWVTRWVVFVVEASRFRMKRGKPRTEWGLHGTSDLMSVIDVCIYTWYLLKSRFSPSIISDRLDNAIYILTDKYIYLISSIGEERQSTFIVHHIFGFINLGTLGDVPIRSCRTEICTFVLVPEPIPIVETLIVLAIALQICLLYVGNNIDLLKYWSAWLNINSVYKQWN